MCSLPNLKNVKEVIGSFPEKEVLNVKLGLDPTMDTLTLGWVVIYHKFHMSVRSQVFEELSFRANITHFFRF